MQLTAFPVSRLLGVIPEALSMGGTINGPIAPSKSMDSDTRQLIDCCHTSGTIHNLVNGRLGGTIHNLVNGF